MSPADAKTGSLLFKSADGNFVEAPRLNTDVAITVNGTIARAVVTQRFENPSARWLEGIYVFPLPEQSAVDALRMQIGDRVIEGEIKTRGEAKELYEAAKDAGSKASLVEQERPNIFTNSVANIGPHESVVIRIEYQETVKQDAGIYSLRFPLVVAPRYNPAPSDVNLVVDDGKPVVHDPVPDRDRISPPVLDPDKFAKINPVSIKVTINAGFALGDVTSAFHKIALDRTSDDEATLTLADGEVPADKDFELIWKPKAAATPQAALFHETVGGADYVLAMVTPPTLDAAPVNLPREIIFVIDNSGSMAGTSIVQAKQSLLFALDRLRPGDRFNVIRFDDTIETLFDNAVDATSDNLAIAKHFVSRLDAAGGTEMLPALKAALKDASPNDTTRLRQVVFLTDGAVGNEDQLFDTISARLGRSRLFTVGIGSAPNSHFMRRAAELGRGTFTHIGAEDQVLTRMSALFTKLERPVMVGLKATWPAGASVEVWPDPLPDLYAGEPVVLSAKLPSREGELRLEGTFAGRPWNATIRLADAVEGAGVAKLWARSKIASLESRLYSGANVVKINKEIETVALQHHLVSSQTSLVAIDTLKSRPDGKDVTTANMPVNLPDGWEYDKVFGPQAAPQHAMLKAVTPLGYAGHARATPRLAFDGGVPASGAAVPRAPLAQEQAPDAEVLPTAAEEPAASPVEPSLTAKVEPDLAAPVVPSVVTPAEPSLDTLSTFEVGPETARRIELFALLLIVLSGMTLLVWRYHRRDYTSPRRIRRRI